MALTMAKAVQRCATGVSARKPLETHREPYLTRSKTERIRKVSKSLGGSLLSSTAGPWSRISSFSELSSDWLLESTASTRTPIMCSKPWLSTTCHELSIQLTVTRSSGRKKRSFQAVSIRLRRHLKLTISKHF